MNKDLPNIFVNKIDKDIRNDQEVFSNIDNHPRSSSNVLEKINRIFSGTDFVYKKDVKITTKDGIMNTTIVGISNDNLLTMDNKTINISDIIDID